MNTPLTGRIARTAARRPWLTVGIWLAALAGAVVLAGTVTQYVTPSSLNLVTTEADQVNDLDQELRASSSDESYSEQVVVQSDTLSIGDSEFDAAIADAVQVLDGIDGVGDIVTPASGALVADTGHAALVTFTITADDVALKEAMDAVDAVSTDAVDAFVYGPASAELAINEMASESLARGEGIGVMVALVVLLIVFGTVVAAGLPLVIAIVSILTATGLAAIIARTLDGAGIEVSDSLTIFVGMMGLALGIDYSLLVVQRFREELENGRDVMGAIAVTGSTANRAVLISGGTVVVSLGGLFFVPMNTFLGIGIGIVLVATMAVTASLTLMPALLRLLGHRVNKLRLPLRHPGHESRGWRRLSAWVVRRPGLAAAGGLGALALLIVPVFTLNIASPDPQTWPEDSLVHQANDVFVEDFGWNDSATTVAVTDAAGQEAAVEALAAAVEADHAFAGTTVSWHGDTAFIDTYDVYSTDEPESSEAIERLRADVIPASLAGTSATGLVGGDRAGEVDSIDLLITYAPWTIVFILLVTFVLLLVMFRSVVVPLKAILLNLLGTAATFGALVAVYQWGLGAGLGFPELTGISPWMPVLVFALVFGLSMDYHVFLMSRIRERYDATGDNKIAVEDGLTRTGPLITGAALIMIGVFGGFASASIPELSQWGFGLAAGVLIDATIVRVLLVPAAMVWLDRANWYLPRWLEWLPRLEVEIPPAPTTPQTTDDEREPALA